jgi:hypothetical protein
MLLVVFPFAASKQESELPVVFAQVVGDVDAISAAPSPPSVSPRTGGDAGPRFSPDSAPSAESFQRVQPAAPAVAPDLSVIGIGGGAEQGAPSGLSLDAGGGPEFFGVTADAPGARSIVYVVDRSGSMVDTFHRVRAELKRSISALRRSQKFHVIFFNAAEPLENPPLRPVNAIDAHKRQFFAFLENVSPGGGTKPEGALRRALALEPDILYLLSDGISFDPALLQRLSEWNPQRRTRIYTIAYLDQTGRQLLEVVAREHGGEFKFVSEDDLP